MTRGQIDYGMYAPAASIARMSDMGELAVRLGSIVSVDRRGDVLLLDNFEDNVNKWFWHIDGAGGSIALSNDTAKNGAKCLKSVTGNVIGNENQMARYLHYPALSRVGIEASVTFHVDIDYITLALLADDGASYALAQIRYYPNTTTLKYYDSAGVWQTLDTALRFFWSTYCFCTFKLVVDFELDTYWRVVAGNKEYEFSAPVRVLAPSLLGRTLGGYLMVATNANANTTNYFDDFILTQNEP